MPVAQTRLSTGSKLADLDWKGAKVLVVGNGPSARHVRFSDFDRVISCNGAAIAEADVVISRDPKWAGRNFGRVPPSAQTMWVDVGGYVPTALTQIIPRLGAQGWSSSLRGVYCGGHTGYCAAQVADALVGETGEIHLSGFDYSRPEQVWRSYAQAWKHAAPLAKLVCHNMTESLTSRLGTNAIAVHGYYGLGDNIYQRPFLRRLMSNYDEVWLVTTWPQLYHDMPGLRFIDPQSVGLRTQTKNLQRPDVRGRFEPRPNDVEWIRVGYGPTHFQAGFTITEAYERQFSMGLGPDIDFELSPRWSWRTNLFQKLQISGRIGVYRPDTQRREWRSSGRSPQLGVLPAVVEALDGLKWISVADLEDGEEWLTDRQPKNIALELHHGELEIEDLVALFSSASLVVGGCGFAVPLALATRTPLFVVFGGAFPPGQVIDPRLVRETSVSWVAPDPFCSCYKADHDCAKPLNIEDAVQAALEYAGW